MRRTIRDETLLTVMGVTVAMLLGITLVLATGCGASARQKTIRLTYESANIADDQLIEFTKIHGKALYDEAKAAGKTKEQADVDVNAFLVKAQHAHATVEAVRMMATAAAVIGGDQSLSALLKVAAMLTAELKDLGVLR